MNDAAAILVMQYATAAAASSDEWRSRTLSPAHLLHYVYLADLALAASTGQTFTGAPWRFDRYGPFADEVWALMDHASDFDGDEVEREAARLRAQLPTTVRLAIERTLKAFGTDTAALLDHAYKTEPMLGAAPNELLSFALRANEPRVEAPALSAKQQKRQKETLRARYQALRVARRPRPSAPAPRYDEVFCAGAARLHDLGGGEVGTRRGELSIDDSVWRSETRGGRG